MIEGDRKFRSSLNDAFSEIRGERGERIEVVGVSFYEPVWSLFERVFLAHVVGPAIPRVLGSSAVPWSVEIRVSLQVFESGDPFGIVFLMAFEKILREARARGLGRPVFRIGRRRGPSLDSRVRKLEATSHAPFDFTSLVSRVEALERRRAGGPPLDLQRFGG